MTNTKEIWEKYEDEFLKFERIENKRSVRPDLHAFMLLDEMCVDNDDDIVSAAEHDEIWLNASSEDIERLTEPQILELVRCGVMFDEDTESLSMFA